MSYVTTKRKVVSFSLTHEAIRDLDEMAKEARCSKSELIDSVLNFLAGEVSEERIPSDWVLDMITRKAGAALRLPDEPTEANSEPETHAPELPAISPETASHRIWVWAETGLRCVDLGEYVASLTVDTHGAES